MHIKNNLLWRSFYIAVIVILGTGVRNPTQGRTSVRRDWGEEDEVSLTTASWESHRNKGRDQIESWEPSTTSQCLQQRQSHVVMMALLTTKTTFAQNRTWRQR